MRDVETPWEQAQGWYQEPDLLKPLKDRNHRSQWARNSLHPPWALINAAARGLHFSTLLENLPPRGFVLARSDFSHSYLRRRLAKQICLGWAAVDGFHGSPFCRCVLASWDCKPSTDPANSTSSTTWPAGASLSFRPAAGVTWSVGLSVTVSGLSSPCRPTRGAW